MNVEPLRCRFIRRVERTDHICALVSVAISVVVVSGVGDVLAGTDVEGCSGVKGEHSVERPPANDVIESSVVTRCPTLALAKGKLIDECGREDLRYIRG